MEYLKPLMLYIGNYQMNKVKQAIEDILAASLSIAEHENNSGKGEVNHLTIIGGKRRVEYYPTTGTVFANKTETKVAVKRHGSDVQKAIKLAKGERV